MARPTSWPGRCALLVGRRSGAVLVAVAVLAAGCVRGGDEPSADTRGVTTTAVAAPASTSDSPDLATSAERVALVATATSGSVDVFATATDLTPARRIAAAEVTSVEGIPITFLVRSEGPGRVEVLLPVRPNGSTGWVERSAVELSAVRHRIEVSLSDHRIRVYELDELVVDEPIGVGRSDRPTPGGDYFVKELLQPADPSGAYGPYAYGLSGFSNVLETFGGGDAVIGIHGTDEPALLGQDVSSGCIRVHNDVIRRLVEQIGLPLGTPVEILS